MRAFTISDDLMITASFCHKWNVKVWLKYMISPKQKSKKQLIQL